MGSSGLVSLKIVFPPPRTIFVLHYFPSLHPNFTESRFSELIVQCCTWRIRIMYIHPPESVLSSPVMLVHANFLFSACFRTSIWPRSTCTVLLLQSVSVSAVTLRSPSWLEMEYGLPFSPHQAQSTAESTVCLLLLLYFHSHTHTLSLRPPLGASPLQPSRGSQLAF